jgi:hypothetical protein
MSAIRRAAVAVALLLAVASLPLAIDWCGASCEAAHASVTPACHHARSPSARVGQMPAGCGHDHRAAPPATGRATLTLRSIAFDAQQAPAGPTFVRRDVAAVQLDTIDSGPPIASTPLALSTILRV